MQEASIGIISVPVDDPQRAKDFYEQVFGFGVEHDQVMDGGMRWVMLRPSGGGAAITLVTWFETMSPGSMKGTVLNVADIEAAVTRLRSHGALPEGTPWGRWVSVDDTDGNSWVIQQPT